MQLLIILSAGLALAASALAAPASVSLNPRGNAVNIQVKNRCSTPRNIKITGVMGAILAPETPLGNSWSATRPNPDTSYCVHVIDPATQREEMYEFNFDNGGLWYDISFITTGGIGTEAKLAPILTGQKANPRCKSLGNADAYLKSDDIKTFNCQNNVATGFVITTC